VRAVRFVDRHGRRVGGFDADVFRDAANGRFTSLPRGELSGILYRSVEGRAEILFDNSITALAESGDGVRVRFENGSARRFDVVIGADGLHSVVRSLAFGPEARFERFLGYTVAAFESEGYQPRDEDVYVMYSVPGRQVARFAMHDQRTMFLFVVADDESRNLETHAAAGQKAYLRKRFSHLGWECPEILREMENTTDLYFDRVSQIRMASWSKGRIALVGDAAFAPSLLAGQGSALALIGAYVLAGELAHTTRPEEAFTHYEERLRPFMRQKQNAAQSFAGAFAPRTPFGIFLRNQITKAFALPFVARLAFGSDLLDRIDLPDYSRSPAPN
jgi:2-polyprenyl-6-methoxyphenol hydroxylase-like FAD-dependent oxidoreductase